MTAPSIQGSVALRRSSRMTEDQIMSGATEQFEGGCLCGAVRFTATGRPKGIYWCHCQSCRKHTGAPVSVFVAFEPEAYKVTKGEITKFDSSRVEPGADFARVNLDLRSPSPNQGNALPRWRVRSSRTASAHETLLL